MSSIEYHLVSHTHWDREWYRTFQQFRRQLVNLMDNLLIILESQPDFTHFHLDGQSILLEDYLAIRPEKEKALKALARKGRISVGPWYVLNDTYLTHGESTLRNLMIGHRVAERFGKVFKVGYLPDQFGNISQLPQILRGFGIRHALVGRGYSLTGERKVELSWQSPDGSKVFALFLPDWYSNYQRPSANAREAVQQLEKARDKQMPWITAPMILLMNGCDHLDAQSEIPDIIKTLNQRLSGDKVIHSRLDEFLRHLEKATPAPMPWTGELREDMNAQVLAGTLSSRVYLKQANNRCESALLTAETLQIMASLLGASCDKEYLEYTWKLLLTNHPHDSICGCSIDPVHREMITRFDQVEQIAAELTRESLEAIGSSVQIPSGAQAGKGLVAVNPVAVARKEVLNATLDFPLSPVVRRKSQLEMTGKAPRQISILDEKGEVVPFHLISSEQTTAEVLSPSELPQCMMVQRFQVQIPVEFRPLEYRTFQVLPRKGKSARGRTKLKVGNNRMENEHVLVMIGGDGSISLRDKRNGHLYGPLLVFEDSGDVGDEYLYRCPSNDRSVTTRGRPAQIRPVSSSPYQGTLQIERIIPLPETADLNEERRVRDTVDCPIHTRITLQADDPTLYCETRLENRAQYHRLRVLFRSNLPSERAIADSPFDMVERSARPPEEWLHASTQFPLRSFVAIENETQGLAVFTRGLHEYELTDMEQGTLALTLLRCVGHLSRGADNHYIYETPEAQCAGIHRFEYAVHPYPEITGRAMLPRLAEAYNRATPFMEFSPARGKQPRRAQILQVDPVEILTTAIKPCEERNSLVVRLVNLGEAGIEATLTTELALKEAHRLDLLEKRKGKLPIKRGQLKLSFKPREMVTIELVMG